MNPTIIKKITFPLWELASGRKRLRYLKQMEKSQFWHPDRLKTLQDECLRQLIVHAYNNVPYYHEIFTKNKLRPGDIKTTSDLWKIPVLTKDIIAGNFEKLKARNMNEFRPEYYQTGGTTGRPLHFFSTARTFDSHMAALYRGWRWSGWDFGERYAYIWGSSMDLGEEHTLKKRIRRYLTDNRLTIQAYTFTDDKLAEDCRSIIEFNPSYIVAYPTPLIIIMRYMKKKNMHLRVKGIITSSESLLSWQRKQIEEFFNCRIFDDYGTRESSIRATQCEEVSGYHIAAENGIIETLSKGKNVTGKMGKIVLTEFNNYAMPLIRYENGDVGVLSDGVCGCGRTLPMLDKIYGRVSDIFITDDGQYIPAQLFMYAFLNFKGDFYQVVQEKNGDININIVKGEHFTDDNLIEIKKEISKWVGNMQKIKFNYISDIPLSGQGKRRYFVSKKKLKI